MKAAFFLLTLGLGVVLAVHLAMNGRVGSAVQNPQMANALFWCIGAVAAIVVGLTAWETEFFGRLQDVNPVLFTAGIMGALLVFAIAALIPKVGAGALFMSLLAGQVITAVVLSHYGWLGSPEQPITLIKSLGVVLLLGGAAIVTFVD